MAYEPDEQMDLRYAPQSRPSTSDIAERTLTDVTDLVVRAADILDGLSGRINFPPADLQKILNWFTTYGRLYANVTVSHETQTDERPRSRRCGCGSDKIRNVDVCVVCERWQ